MAADACSTPPGRLFITSLSAPAQMASTRFPNVKTIGSSTPTDDHFAEFPDLHASRESSGRCATTRSQHTGTARNVRYYIAPHRPTTNRSTHRASPENRPRRAYPLTCSLVGSPHPSGQQATQGRPAHLQPRRISRLSGQQVAQANSLTCSLAGPLRNAGQPAAQDTHSPAATPDHCASSPTDYPGTQMPVAGRQRHTAPDLRPPPHWIGKKPSSTSPADNAARTTAKPTNHADHPLRPTRPLPGAVQRVSIILREGVMWGHTTSLSAALFRVPPGHPNKST